MQSGGHAGFPTLGAGGVHVAHLEDGHAGLIEAGEGRTLPPHKVHRLPGMVEPVEQLHSGLPVAHARPLVRLVRPDAGLRNRGI